jgi:hypothetical protein
MAMKGDSEDKEGKEQADIQCKLSRENKKSRKFTY